ncbi:MAG: hypothetical protein RL261_2248 [Pseudomonadota bacterium]|jgi:hypothetical protein
MTKSAATSVKTVRKSAVGARRATRPTTRNAPAAAAEPSLRFHYSESLRVKTHAVLDALEAAPGHPGHADAMAGVVGELIDAGMDFYFMRALRQADVGFVAEQTARVGMSGALTVVSSMCRKYIVRMSSVQLLVVARHIRELS